MAKVDHEEQYSEIYQSYEQPPPDIVVFNELRSCADLYRLYEKEQIEIRPFFQREGVWSIPDQTRFIDSLIKQLPIPSMCFAFDYNTRKWIVIDGLQRMTAITRFLNPENKWTLSKLEDIDPNLSGKNSTEFHDSNSELHNYLERVENLTLPITVLRCDFKQESHMEYLFKIFHRLNTGGVRLNNQEIRNCIYSGSLNNCLLQLDKETNWLKIKSYVNGKKDRFRAVELILRILSFKNSLLSYKGNLARFLNEYMFIHRRESPEEIEKFKNDFSTMTRILIEKILPRLTASKFGFTQIEALAIGVISNLDRINQMSDEELSNSIIKFESIDLLKTEALSADISKTDSVKQRIQESINAFR